MKGLLTKKKSALCLGLGAIGVSFYYFLSKRSEDEDINQFFQKTPFQRIGGEKRCQEILKIMSENMKIFYKGDNQSNFVYNLLVTWFGAELTNDQTQQVLQIYSEEELNNVCLLVKAHLKKCNVDQTTIKQIIEIIKYNCVIVSL